jgi:hypothetical protein
MSQSSTCTDLYTNRDGCVQCCFKHIAQARALVCETKKGYPEHYYYAMGHMAEAEDEILAIYPEVMEAIRSERLAYQEDREKLPDWKHLMETLMAAEFATEQKLLEELGINQ